MWKPLRVALAALLMAGVAGASDLQLSTNSFTTGSVAVATTSGTPGTWYSLCFDLEEGDHWFPGGAWFGLAGGANFALVNMSVLPSSGTEDFYLAVPDDPGLVGRELYFQCVGLLPGGSYLLTSNREDVVVSSSDGAQITEVYPRSGSRVDTMDPVFEVFVSATLRDDSVNNSTVILRDLASGEPLVTSVELIEENGRAVISVEAKQLIPRGAQVELEITDDVLDDAGNPLGGERTMEYKISERKHPVLFNTAAEFEIFKTQVAAGADPWKESYTAVKKEADKFALPGNPDPHYGPPPTSKTAFLNMYNRWFTDARYAQTLATTYFVTGDTRYADKAVEYISAWLVMDPEPVNTWHWTIQLDIAGIGFLSAADMMWNYPGMAPYRVPLRVFFNELAAAVKEGQEDTSANTKPNNIRSWNNTLIASVGWFNERWDLVHYALYDQDNPFYHLKMIDEAMEPSGRMFDHVRGGDVPYEGVTYPAYHLYAWMMLSEVALHHGLDLYGLKNRDGNTQMKGWTYLYPYMTREERVDGLTVDIIQDFMISRLYPLQKVARRDDFEYLFNLYDSRPHYDTHIFKRNATLLNNLPTDLVGKNDDQPPGAPESLALNGLGATMVHLRWDEPEMPSHADIVSTYLVKRNGVEILRTSDPWIVDRDLEPNTSYSYEVHALDYLGNVSSPGSRTIRTRKP